MAVNLGRDEAVATYNKMATKIWEKRAKIWEQLIWQEMRQCVAKYCKMAIKYEKRGQKYGNS